MPSDVSFSYPEYPCNPGECLNGIHTVDLVYLGSDKVGHGNPYYNGWTEVGAKNFTQHPN